jgi:hypothetical protein
MMPVDHVAQTRALWQRQPFVWGETDCIMAVCTYIASVTGIDPAAPWRGTYNDEAGAAAIFAPYGGVFGLFARGMQIAGFMPCDPYDGAPVIVSFHGHEIAGILCGKRVAFMAEKGMIEVRTKVLCAW